MAFFGKSDAPPPPANPSPSTPLPERTPPPPPPAPSVGAAAQTVIGSRVKIVGDVSGDEDIVLNGRLEGKIRVDRKVTVSSGAEIEGDVAGKNVVIGGRVHGQVMASERAELLATGRVQGNVQSPRIVMAEGAQIQGRVIMPTEGSAKPIHAPRAETAPKPDVAARPEEPARRPLVPPKPEEPARRPVSPSGTGG